ncbi:MAG TPA: hypothetical protein VKU00_17595, partial [Chthonomonadaceae bacterium]|nr:hypothetical protein [Chthonomonadaceae bacterium]
PEVPNTDFHLATPVGRLKAFLDRPEITLTPTNMPFSQATKAQDFHIGLTWFHKSEGAITVTLMAGEENGGERHWTVPLSRAGDYRTKLTLLSPRGGSALLRLTVKTKMDLLTCQVRDHPVTVGHRTIRLSDIQRIELGDRPTAWLVREDPLHEKTSGLDALQATVNGLPATLDLSKADQIVVEEIDPRPNSLPWRVTITQQGHVTGELSGNFVFENTSLPAKRGMILIAAGGTATMTGKFDNGLANRPEDVRRYILNVAVFFMGGRRGRCLIYSDNGVFGDFFRETLQQAGYTVVHDIHPKSLDEYDVVFTGGSLYVDRSALVPYVQRGGKVYLAGGCGQEGPYWADFLRPFGLSIGPDTYMRGADSTPETVRNFGAHSLLQGVNELIFQGISPIHLLPGEWPHVHILVTLRDVNLWAAYIGDPFGI